MVQIGIQPGAPGQPAGAPAAQWMPMPQGIVGCPPGLEYLTHIDNILVHQLTTRFDGKFLTDFRPSFIAIVYGDNEVNAGKYVDLYSYSVILTLVMPGTSRITFYTYLISNLTRFVQQERYITVTVWCPDNTQVNCY